MLKKIVIAGSAAAVVLGAGTAALAASGSSSTPTPSTSSSSAATPAHKAAAHKAKAGKAKSELRRSLHATWVTRDGKNKTTYVTHDAIRGSVTAVSATSITVQAADKVSQTYAIGSTTKVHSRAAGKGKTAPVSDLHTGDKVLVVGTGTTSKAATQIVDATK